MAEGIKSTVNNLANLCGGVKMTKSLQDILYPPEVDTRTEEEVVLKIKEKLLALGG